MLELICCIKRYSSVTSNAKSTVEGCNSGLVDVADQLLCNLHRCQGAGLSADAESHSDDVHLAGICDLGFIRGTTIHGQSETFPPQQSDDCL